ncbi:hypothetical protein KK062_29775 [Fulvivirgaceae bacterium PWU5]|uniref:Uncharacterized protein n=1 Tax=Dawidia cretensis TaxID=2782350 RepID=A0AAP2E3L2_9BACT|nr:hypothetical protein [Dawidia cretensis]MBT1712461.1 hypothetical protein [Dawidia cretensis]
MELNQASVISLARSNEVIRKTLEIIRNNSNAKIIEDDSYEHIIRKFKEFFKIITVKDLQDSLERDQKEFLRFSDYFSRDINVEKLPSYLPLFYYQHYLSAKSEDLSEVIKYFTFPKITDIDFSKAAEIVIDAYKRAKYESISH